MALVATRGNKSSLPVAVHPQKTSVTPPLLKSFTLLRPTSRSLLEKWRHHLLEMNSSQRHDGTCLWTTILQSLMMPCHLTGTQMATVCMCDYFSWVGIRCGNPSGHGCFRLWMVTRCATRGHKVFWKWAVRITSPGVLRQSSNKSAFWL